MEEKSLLGMVAPEGSDDRQFAGYMQFVGSFKIKFLLMII